jgi:chemotaxis protein methyltransferase WspC
MQRIESVLRREIGLDAASLGSSAIERTVWQRMKSLGLKDPREYEKLLETSRVERDELVEAVVVLETWFFRDRGPFTALRQLALEWMKQPAIVNLPSLPSTPHTETSRDEGGGLEGGEGQKSTRTLRILSVPCSTGEEPYSLAMTLLDAGIPPHRFVINAVDISAQALARAREAIYGKNSFRGKDLEFREHHFRQTKVDWPSPPSTPLTKGSRGEGGGLEGGEGHKMIGYALNTQVRECVQFYRDNLLGDTFLVGHALYDFIFCRNLLIYFDRATQVRAMEKLHALLAPQGMLFVGPAELPLVTHNGFTDANLTMAFVCRKTAGADKRNRGSEFVPREQAPAVVKPNEVRTPPSANVAEKASQLRGVNQLPRSRGAVRTTTTGASDLDVARQLADAGRLQDAVAVCEKHLRREGPSAEAYYLLGLVRDATGDPRAMEYYRKALYLKPDHYEALLQMSLLLEKTGDSAGARNLKRRAQRVQHLPAHVRPSSVAANAGTQPGMEGLRRVDEHGGKDLTES